MGKRRRNEFEEAAMINQATYDDYCNRITRIATAIFEWENLPDSMDQRYLERCLFYNGAAALLNDETFGFINTKATSHGKYNIYGLPTTINCYSYSYNQTRRLYTGNNTINNSSEDEHYDDCILVMNNWQRVPTWVAADLFARRLSECERTIDVNIKAQKTPVLVITDQNTELTMKNTYQQYDGNSPVLFASKNSFNPDSIRSITTEAPYVVDKIDEHKKIIWNELLTMLGINNLYEKKERMVSSETSQNNEVINLNLQAGLAPRELACKQFNERFGKNISVKVRSDLENIIKQEMSVTSDLRPKEGVTQNE